MKASKRLLSALCAATLAISLAVPALAYGDVSDKHWAHAEIQAVTDLGLMTGGAGGNFFPDAYVTRSAVITTLWRLAGSPEGKGESFPDVSEKHWAHDAAVWAREAGIATGGDHGAFSPDDNITREQLAVFLYRYALYQGEDIAEGVVDLYPDAQYIHKWALDGMKHALGAGLMTGTSVGLSPLGFATRAELAKILVRLNTPVQG